MAQQQQQQTPQATPKQGRILRIELIQKTPTFSKSFQRSYGLTMKKTLTGSEVPHLWFEETPTSVLMYRDGDSEYVELPKSNLHIVRAL